MLTTPGGNPASLMRWHTRIAVSGVNSEGLSIIVFPVARAGPGFQANMSTTETNVNSRRIALLTREIPCGDEHCRRESR
ncbi:hypothetical protein L210DRAFT_2212402, partial [Boletus edulis BED1]